MNGSGQPNLAESQFSTSLKNNAGGINPSAVLAALETIYNPHTDNSLRQIATKCLDDLKGDENVVQYGHALSSDESQPVQVRFQGLTLLEHFIQHKWHELHDEQATQIRQYIVLLGSSMKSAEPLYLRNKVARLWIELAKRSWALDWFDMDAQLIQIWQKDPVSKIFVLTVLENLSEDVFVREDPGAVLRGRDLSTALVNIFTSNSEHTGDIKIGQNTYSVRSTDEGWLARINDFLSECLHNDTSSADVRACVCNVLATLRSVFSWVMTTSIANSGCLNNICNCLSKQDTDILMAAVDSLHTLYGRSRLEDLDIDNLVYPICHPSAVSLLRQVYNWTIVDIDELESPKYAISKKLSELLSHIAEWITHKPPTGPADNSLSEFLGLMISVAEHTSLIVSIPLVHAWTKLLAQSYWSKSQVISTFTGQLLQLACRRTLQFDAMPETEKAVIFVHDEIELFPERQGFFLNYRRFCCTIVELVTFAHLYPAMELILKEVDRMLDEVQSLEVAFDPTSYSKNSEAAILADAQFNIVEAAFKGFSSWRSAILEDLQDGEKDALAEKTTCTIREWAIGLLSKRIFKDPAIRQRVIKTAVETSNRALENETDFAIVVLEHTVNAIIPHQSDFTMYTEAVDDLQLYATSELIRLAVHHADYFVTLYDRLEMAIRPKISSTDFHEAARVGLSATLFLIVQRATNVDDEVRKHRLWAFLEPVLLAWRSDDLRNSLASFDSFTSALQFNRVGPYMASINAAALHDWPEVLLNSDGAQLREDMRLNMSLLPMRLTRTMLQVSTDKLKHHSSGYRLICDLWAPVISEVFDGILQLITYNHQLHNPAAWPNLPVEIQIVARKILQDRYWQSGISEVSMAEFQARIKSSKDTLEGFASSVRGKIRTNLENCYSILHTLGRLGDQFYTIPQMPDRIAQAVLVTAGSLSPHHFSVLLSMLIKLIDECPPAYRAGFLPPILSTLFTQLDHKCLAEWKSLEERKVTVSKGDELGEEMRDDSILRNFTYKAVNLVAHVTKPTTKKPKSNGGDVGDVGSPLSVTEVVLTNAEILVPLFRFCTHALRWHDTKTCTNAIRVLRVLVPPFATGPWVSSSFMVEVRKFLSQETLIAACLTLHDAHFVDQQKDVANLIATIIIVCGLPTHITATETSPAYERPPLDLTWRTTLLSIPGMTPERVDDTASKLAQEGGVNGNGRHQRALILSLFEHLRGVRLSELGKIDTSQQKSKLIEKYMRRESMGIQGGEDGVQPSNVEGEELDLGGVSEMFT